jgi:hypothetical protein
MDSVVAGNSRDQFVLLDLTQSSLLCKALRIIILSRFVI